MTSTKSTTPGPTQSDSNHSSPSNLQAQVNAITEKHSIERGWTVVMRFLQEDADVFFYAAYVLHKLDLVNRFELSVMHATFQKNVFNEIRKGAKRR